VSEWREYSLNSLRECSVHGGGWALRSSNLKAAHGSEQSTLGPLATPHPSVMAMFLMKPGPISSQYPILHSGRGGRAWPGQHGASAVCTPLCRFGRGKQLRNLCQHVAHSLCDSHGACAAAKGGDRAGALGQHAHPGLHAIVVGGDAVVDGVGVAPRLVAAVVCKRMGEEECWTNWHAP